MEKDDVETETLSDGEDGMWTEEDLRESLKTKIDLVEKEKEEAWINAKRELIQTTLDYERLELDRETLKTFPQNDVNLKRLSDIEEVMRGLQGNLKKVTKLERELKKESMEHELARASLPNVLERCGKESDESEKESGDSESE